MNWVERFQYLLFDFSGPCIFSNAIAQTGLVGQFESSSWADYDEGFVPVSVTLVFYNRNDTVACRRTVPRSRVEGLTGEQTQEFWESLILGLCQEFQQKRDELVLAGDVA